MKAIIGSRTKSRMGFLSLLCGIFFLAGFLSGCKDRAESFNKKEFKHVMPRLVVIAPDESGSFKKFRKIDSTYVRRVCNMVEVTGGMVAFYGLGNPNDLSALRCYLSKVPLLDDNLPLTKKAEMKARVDAIKAENDKHIFQLLEDCQKQFFTKCCDSSTDIIGFFKKAEVLIQEPQHAGMDCYIFCYTDGIQSINGRDTPARYRFKPPANFTLCLAGWKTELPCDSNIRTKTFEDPQGFLEYLTDSFNQLNSNNYEK